MRRLGAVLPMLALAACGGRTWSPTAAESAPELFVVAETSRFSGIAGQRVHGEISTEFYQVNCADGSPLCHAFGWYVGAYGRGAKGTAFYYEKDVNKADDPSLSWASSHEVCHSVTGAPHDERHATCNKTLYGGAMPAAAARFRCRFDTDSPDRGGHDKGGL